MTLHISWGQNFVEIALSRTISQINVLLHFVEIVLSHTLSKINALLYFTQNFKMAAQNGGKTIIENWQCVDTVSKINALFCFM